MPNPGNITSPIVLVGSGRSGTSLVSALFMQHPDVRFVGETAKLIFDVWSAIDETVGIVPPLIENGEPVDHQEVAARAVRQTFLTCFPDELPRWMQKPIGVPNVVMERFSRSQDWDQTAAWYWGALMRAFPDATVFTILRQPCDVVLSSCARWGYPQEDVWWGLTMMSHLLCHPSSPVRYAISYERLVREPEGETRRLFEHVGLPFRSDVLAAFAHIHAAAPGREQVAPGATSRREGWDGLDPRRVGAEHLRAVVRGFERFGLACELPAAFRRKAEGSPGEAGALVEDAAVVDETEELRRTVRELRQEIGRLHVDYAHKMAAAARAVIEAEPATTRASRAWSARPEGGMDGSIARMPLIMDVGMHGGRDSRFYLQKGFRVVAVEANPRLVERVRRELAGYLESGQLVIEAVGLGPVEGEFPFYVNLDNDHWSSLEKAWGTRQNTRYREIMVPCVRPGALFEQYGMPYYLKIDIEGRDIEVVRALHDFRDRPRFVSVEAHEAWYCAELWAVGCRAFKLVDQRRLGEVRCPNPPREGRYVDATFDPACSGPFGEEIPGEWLSFDVAVECYLTEIRSPTRGYLAGHSWFDVHGRID